MAQDKFAIDFDCAVTNIYKLGSGLVLSEPTVASVDTSAKGQVKAIGLDASKLIGKTAKSTQIVFPVFEGEIVNEKVAIDLLSNFLQKTGFKGGIRGATAVFSVPCGITAEMLDKYKAVAKGCGITNPYFVESPILSVIGEHIPITDSAPCFVIDMAGGMTNIGAVSMDGIIAGVSVNFGGNKVSTDIIDYIAENYGLQIGLQTAERLKKEIGSLDKNDGLATVVNGRDSKTGTPRAISIKASELFEPVRAYYDKIVDIALTVLKKLPPEVSAEIRHAGIYVSGGASSVYGLANYYNEKFGMQINVAEKGLYSVALGGGIAVGNPAMLKKIALISK